MSPIESRSSRAFESDSPLTVTSASEVDLPKLPKLERLGIFHPWTERGFLDELDHSESRLLIARRDATGEPVGFLAARRCIDEAEIVRVVVDPSERQRGVATQLLIEAIRLLTIEGVHELFLEVREDNSAALGLYRKFSFRVLKQRPNYTPDGCTALVLKADSADLKWIAAA